MRDIAKALVLALDVDKAVGEAFTIGGLLTIWEDLVPALSKFLDLL